MNSTNRPRLFELRPIKENKESNYSCTKAPPAQNPLCCSLANNADFTLLHLLLGARRDPSRKHAYRRLIPHRFQQHQQFAATEAVSELGLTKFNSPSAPSEELKSKEAFQVKFSFTDT